MRHSFEHIHYQHHSIRERKARAGKSDDKAFVDMYSMNDDKNAPCSDYLKKTAEINAQVDSLIYIRMS